MLVAALLPFPGAAAGTERTGAQRLVVVHGHGFGHGIGMSQYGAEGAARAGRSYRQILRFYYPHTKRARAGGPLRVLLTADTTRDVTVHPTSRLRVRDLADGRTWRLPSRARHAQLWRIVPVRHHAARSSVQWRDGRGWHRWNLPGRRTVLRGDGQFAAKGPIRLVHPGGSVTRYRGILRSASPTPRSTTRDTVNVVSLDQYVRGVLPAEMPPSWSVAALRAQAVAARTFAAWSRRGAGNRHWQVCDTSSCQVYGGIDAETARTNAAAARTAQRILTYRHRPALTMFSASSGGWTVSGGRPYLPARADRWDGWAGNGYHDWWSRTSVGSLESSYPSVGRLTSVRVTKRDGHGHWGGRALALVLRGSAGRVRLSGDDLRWTLGLPSTWFTVALKRP